MLFSEKLRAAQAANHSYVCVGLDPDVTRLPSGLEQHVSGLLAFCKAIIDSTADVASAFKPNLAFFLAHGGPGIDALRELVAHIPTHLPIILDAKFGDIGHTAAQYATFAFEHLRVDAVTVSPYIGTEAIRPFLAYADKLAFVLSRTSNTQGNEFQAWPDAGKSLYEFVAEQMMTLSKDYPQQIGLVVGATQPSELSAVRNLAPELVFLVPGIGAQGGDLAAVVEHGMTASGLGPVINTGRTVLYASAGSDFAEAARKQVIALNSEIASLRIHHVN